MELFDEVVYFTERGGFLELRVICEKLIYRMASDNIRERCGVQDKHNSSHHEQGLIRRPCYTLLLSWKRIRKNEMEWTGRAEIRRAEGGGKMREEGPGDDDSKVRIPEEGTGDDDQ